LVICDAAILVSGVVALKAIQRRAYGTNGGGVGGSQLAGVRQGGEGVVICGDCCRLRGSWTCLRIDPHCRRVDCAPYL